LTGAIERKKRNHRPYSIRLALEKGKIKRPFGRKRKKEKKSAEYRICFQKPDPSIQGREKKNPKKGRRKKEGKARASPPSAINVIKKEKKRLREGGEGEKRIAIKLHFVTLKEEKNDRHLG